MSYGVSGHYVGCNITEFQRCKFFIGKKPLRKHVEKNCTAQTLQTHTQCMLIICKCMVIYAHWCFLFQVLLWQLHQPMQHVMWPAQATTSNVLAECASAWGGTVIQKMIVEIIQVIYAIHMQFVPQCQVALWGGTVTEKMILEMDQVMYANLMQIYVHECEVALWQRWFCGDGSGNLC